VQRLIAAAALATLGACASAPPRAVPREAPQLRLAPALLGHALNLQQHLTLQAPGREQQLDVLLEADAQHVQLGVVAMGQRADLNVIDPKTLSVGAPKLVRDLPAGGRRFLQKGAGYLGTWVAGQAVQRQGDLTGARPGRLVRAGR